MMNAVKILLSNERKSQVSERNRETLTQLKFIGMFQPGEKINTRSMCIEPNNIFTPIIRRIFGEGRETTLQFLSNTIERTFEIIQYQVVSTRMADQLQAQNTVTDLIKAIIGLKNLQKTYKDDKLFYCEIETLIETIHTRLVEFQTQYPDIIKQSMIEDVCRIMSEENTPSSMTPNIIPLSSSGTHIPSMTLGGGSVGTATLNQQQPTVLENTLTSNEQQQSTEQKEHKNKNHKK